MYYVCIKYYADYILICYMYKSIFHELNNSFVCLVESQQYHLQDLQDYKVCPRPFINVK